jgi:hypothetical protein
VEGSIINPAVEDSYELAPMQQGMLFDTLQAPRADVYCMLVAYTLRGPLNRAAFIEAWQQVVARHPILRTSFEWDEHSGPVQMVHRSAIAAVFEDDWRGMNAAEQHDRLTALLRAESLRGFNLHVAPLIRLSLVQCDENVHQFVLAQHHILMDGSCKPILFQDAFAWYHALCGAEQPELDPPRPYRDFIVWLRELDLAASEAFWRGELAGFTEPTPLWQDRAPKAAAEGYAEHEARLDEAATEALRQFARRTRLTLNTIVIGLWALTLSRTAAARDVVFGTTVNVRPPLVDAETMLGLFINTLPVRVLVEPDTTVASWLRRIQMTLAGARDHAFAPLSRIRSWSDVTRGRPLFESIVVFENNPGYGLEVERYGDIEITSARPLTRNSLPLTLRVVPSRALAVQLLYETERFAPETIHRIGAQLIDLFREIGTYVDRPVSDFLARLEQLEAEHQARDAATYEHAIADRLRSLKRQRRGARES